MKKNILKISEVSISGVYCKHIDEAEWTVNSRFRVFTFPDVFQATKTFSLQIKADKFWLCNSITQL